ncbi:MAG TPA: hypothetical protein PLN69_07840, partial [bacterium]|nr:hypothetical protein [bacterium]
MKLLKMHRFEFVILSNAKDLAFGVYIDYQNKNRITKRSFLDSCRLHAGMTGARAGKPFMQDSMLFMIIGI